MEKMKTWKGIPAWIIALALIAVVATVSAVPILLWHMNITWTPAVVGFGVYTDAACTIPWEQGNLDLGIVLTDGQYYVYPDTKRFDFYLKNEGDVEITVSVISEDAVGCTALWSMGGSFSMPVNDDIYEATLMLTITGAGHYTFDFDAEPIPPLP